MKSESITLQPKIRFLANPATASAHADMMATPAFQTAAATALLAYAYRLGGSDPQSLAIAMSKLNGAREFLRELMNLGLPDTKETIIPDAGLRPPEECLDRPYQPPTKN
jgi:hypothetical protein